MITPEQIKTSSSSSSDEVFTYKHLTGHATSSGEYKSSEKLRMEYIQLTDELIHKITHGVEVVNPNTGEHEIRQPEKVIFLDKSARPVAWLMREMWNEYATDEDGATYPQPDIHFLNIDREQWVNTVDPQGVGHMDINKVDDTVIRSLRSIFISPNLKREGLVEAIDTTPASLDDKVVLIVDEVMSSGRTLDIAQKMVKRAFPTALVSGTHWMKGLTTRNNGLSVGNNDLPVWYKDKDEYGRGIGNRERDPSDSNAQNLTQRLGRWFLSTRLSEIDNAGRELRNELKQLAHDPAVMKRPSLQRDDYEERVERLNKQPYSVAQQAIMDVARSK